MAAPSPTGPAGLTTETEVTFSMPDGAVELTAVYAPLVRVTGGTLVLDGTTATVTADPDSDGMVFSRWELLAPTEGLEDLDLTARTLTFPTPQGDLILRAVFVPADSAVWGAPAGENSYAIIHGAARGGGNTVTAKLSCLLKDGAAPTALCAFYDGEGRMIAVRLEQLAFGSRTVTFHAPGSFASARLLVLEGTGPFSPNSILQTIHTSDIILPRSAVLSGHMPEAEWGEMPREWVTVMPSRKAESDTPDCWKRLPSPGVEWTLAIFSRPHGPVRAFFRLFTIEYAASCHPS